MAKKILLISSSFEEISLVTASEKQKAGAKTTDESHYPVGIAYLHAYLESQGHEIKSLFLNNRSFSDCLETVSSDVKTFEPDIVGFQILTPNRISSYRLIEHLHEFNPDIQLVAGGIHATLMHRQLIEKYPYLIVVLGEGEITLAELAAKYDGSTESLGQIDGLAFLKDHQVITTNRRKLIENLDELPLPKHEVFFHDNRASASILTARGCPFNCSFCCLDVLSQRRVRKRSVASIITEIEWLKNKFPQLKKIWIHDDTFFIDTKRVIEFCDEIVKRNIKLQFTCSGRVKPISAEMVKKLEQAGFTKVLLGLESGDEEILKRCHKNITQQDVIDAFKLFAKTKISVYAFLIIGLPGETLETVLNTVRFVQKIQRIKYVYYNEDVAILSVYPGTEVYEIAKAGGMINDEYWLTDKPTPIFTLESDYSQLLKFKNYLLDRISLDRYFTLAGFRAQFWMTPYIIKYLIINKSILFTLSYKFLHKVMPKKIFLILKQSYKILRNKNHEKIN